MTDKIIEYTTSILQRNFTIAPKESGRGVCTISIIGGSSFVEEMTGKLQIAKLMKDRDVKVSD